MKPKKPTESKKRISRKKLAAAIRKGKGRIITFDEYVFLTSEGRFYFAAHVVGESFELYELKMDKACVPLVGAALLAAEYTKPKHWPEVIDG